MYPAAVVAFALLALIGWIVTLRFGWRGTAVFLCALAVVGALRDYHVRVVQPGRRAGLAPEPFQAGRVAEMAEGERLQGHVPARRPGRIRQKARSWPQSSQTTGRASQDPFKE
jgi:hypothetical protein